MAEGVAVAVWVAGRTGGSVFEAETVAPGVAVIVGESEGLGAGDRVGDGGAVLEGDKDVAAKVAVDDAAAKVTVDDAVAEGEEVGVPVMVTVGGSAGVGVDVGVLVGAVTAKDVEGAPLPG